MIRFFAGHPTAANLLMIGILALGLSALPDLERETFPDLPLSDVQVRVAYPGASAEEIEDAICRRIEDAVDGINDIAELRCEAREGVATAVVEMDQDGNIDRFLDDVKSEVEAIDDFPVRTERVTIQLLGRNDFVAAVSVSGPMSESDLKAYAEDMKERLQQITQVTQVDIKGFSDHQIRIEIPAQTLLQYGLSVSDIAGVIGRQSIDLPAGSVETDERDVLIRFADERRTAADFGDLIVVGAESGAEIRLGEIASIKDRFELVEQNIVYDGRRAALLEISKARSGDTLVVVDAVNAFLDRERAMAPPAMRFGLTRDVSTVVRDRLNMVLKNGAQGLFLVVLALWLFFGLRFSFWVAMGLPVSFLGTLFVMALGGFSINMITMVGLLIATGLLMDDAIVISENIARHRRDGKAALDAAVAGVREVGLGVLASYLTTICVFGPLTALKGDIGNVLKFIPIILIMTLTVSMIEAFLILPNHLRHSLLHEGEVRGLRAHVENAVAWMRERIAGRAADLAIEYRYAAAGLVLLALLGSVAMLAGGVLKFQAFPKLDGDVVQARLLLPQGTPLARTETIVDRLVETMEGVNRDLSPSQPGGRQLVRQVGIEYGVNSDAFEAGPHLATVTADLLAAESRNTSVAEIIQAWRAAMGAVPDVIALKFAEFQIGIAGRPIDIRLRGADLAVLKSASMDLQAWLSGYPAVFDLSDDLRPGKPEIRLRLREGALALGLDASQIASQLRAAYFGEVVSEIQAGPESYEVDVRLSAADRDSLADLDYFLIRAPGGAQVPLGTAAFIESGRGYARIQRIDGRRTVSVQGDVDTDRMNVSEILSDTERRFLPRLRERFPGVAVSFEGEVKTGTEGTSSVRRAFAIGLVGVFLLLSFLFRSYVESLIVIATIPLSLIGVVWGHLAMGLDLSMPSMVGFAALSGVVVNNAILLVDFIKRRAGDGMEIEDAARMAARIRFRPVLLTSLTTVLGLLPMLLERSLQAQILVPLVTSLAFGLFAATVLVLMIVPALYAILHDFGVTTVARQAEPVPAG
ncbi:MAG: efflux RND transporter permease subunit [Alphaproteobacteria bacterium]|nr:efflux RND transporter permease subunit [Alphaproteobacteria bacterium]